MSDDNHKHEEDEVDASMISSPRPYQSTTEPVPHRRELCGGIIVDIKYMRSLPGMLKIGEILLNIMASVALGLVGLCSKSCGAVAFMRTVAILAIIVTIVIYIVYACTLQKKLSMIDWCLTDLVNCAIFSVCYLIASIIMAVKSEHAADKAATVFGFLLAILYGVNAWFAYRKFVIDRHKRKSAVAHVVTDEENA